LCGESTTAHAEAVAILERLVDLKGRHDLGDDLARALVNEAFVLVAIGRPADALPGLERAIRLRVPPSRMPWASGKTL
jgi:hypothetical protein